MRRAFCAHAASKGGVNPLVDCLAEERGPRGIRVNAVCPGTVETPMNAGVVETLAEMAQTSAEVVRNE